MEQIVEISNLTKRFQRDVLNGIDFSLKDGQVMGLIGRNGAGKTTLIRLILGFLRPTSGIIKVFGKEPGVVSGRIGYLPEKPDYHLLFSAKEYLKFLAKFSDHSGDQADRRVQEVLQFVNMTEQADRVMSRYSKGMLQRIGIAQAILSDPKLLILDEPLSGLDPSGQKELRDIIINLRSSNKSILLCSHLLNEVEKVCTDVAIMKQGRIEHQGLIEALLVDQNRYQFQLSSLRNEDMLALEQNFKLTRLSSDSFVMDECYQGEKERLILMLIQRGIQIQKLNPAKKTLEDHFNSLVVVES